MQASRSPGRYQIAPHSSGPLSQLAMLTVSGLMALTFGWVLYDKVLSHLRVAMNAIGF